MEQYTGDSNDSDGAHNVFSISPVLKEVEKTKDWCRKNGLNIFLVWIYITLNTEENLWFFAPKLKEVHLSSRY